MDARPGSGDDVPVSDDLPETELRAMWRFDAPAASEAVLRAAADGSSTAPARQAELLTQVARALGLQNRSAEANHVLDGIEPLTPAVSVRVLLERGRLHRDAGEFALPAAVSCFEAAAEAARQAGLESLEVDALHMLALADQDRAGMWTDRALGVVRATHDPETRRWAVALENNYGWDLMDRGRPQEALTRFEAAHAAALEVGSPEQEQIGRWAVARCLRELGRHAEALEIQRELADERPEDPYVAEELATLERLVGRDA